MNRIKSDIKALHLHFQYCSSQNISILNSFILSRFFRKCSTLIQNLVIRQKIQKIMTQYKKNLQSEKNNKPFYDNE